MIILDTNIISELMKPLPALQMISWLDKQASDQLYITSITVGEIMYGLHALPAGKRRDHLESAFQKVMLQAFAQRSLSFDDAAALLYGKIMAKSREQGRAMSICDGQIAAMTESHKCTLATRNAKDFKMAGISVINPFVP